MKQYPHILEMLYEYVNAAPHSIAVIEDEISYTYQDLWEFTVSSACELRSYGVKQSEAVAIHSTPSLFSIVSMLAIWMVGAIALPIDKLLPLERKRKLLQTADAKYVLCKNEDDKLQDSH